MYIGKEGKVYMLDRDNAVFSLPSLQFPSKHIGQHLKDTLMDGVIKCPVHDIKILWVLIRRWFLIQFLIEEFAHAI